VRKLAERSQVAAQEIDAVASSSVALAERAGERLGQIVPAIQKTSELVQEIAAASSEQSAGVGQINGAIEQLNQLTQQNASAAEELAATAEELSGQAEQLQQLIAFSASQAKQVRPWPHPGGTSRMLARQRTARPLARPPRPSRARLPKLTSRLSSGSRSDHEQLGQTRRW